jgi:hypothetical protein
LNYWNLGRGRITNLRTLQHPAVSQAKPLGICQFYNTAYSTAIAVEQMTGKEE